MNLISLVGSSGSGKNSVADILKASYNFHMLSFGGCLKDAVAAIFNWDRTLLEGDTQESRAWRETIQVWWADKLDIPGFTPRMALQLFGTDVVRNNFHPDIWLLNIQGKIRDLGPDANIVITDARFPNEMNMTTALGGQIWRVKRGENPAWWDAQLRRSAAFVPGSYEHDIETAESDIDILAKVHESERAWVRADYDCTVENNGSLDDLRYKIIELFGNRFVAPPSLIEDPTARAINSSFGWNL